VPESQILDEYSIVERPGGRPVRVLPCPCGDRVDGSWLPQIFTWGQVDEYADLRAMATAFKDVPLGEWGGEMTLCEPRAGHIAVDQVLCGMNFRGVVVLSIVSVDLQCSLDAAVLRECLPSVRSLALTVSKGSVVFGSLKYIPEFFLEGSNAFLLTEFLKDNVYVSTVHMRVDSDTLSRFLFAGWQTQWSVRVFSHIGERVVRQHAPGSIDDVLGVFPTLIAMVDRCGSGASVYDPSEGWRYALSHDENRNLMYDLGLDGEDRLLAYDPMSMKLVVSPFTCRTGTS
jgi:hypothetical protein